MAPLRTSGLRGESRAASGGRRGRCLKEIEQKLAVTRDLPTEVQKLVWEKAGLLPSVQEDAVLKANAERLIHHTTGMVRQTRLACVQAAIKEDKAKANVVSSSPLICR